MRAAAPEALVVRDGRLSFGPLLMGVVNATPDSFSDGGADAIGAARTMAANPNVAIIDIGGESTRPGASPVSAAAECARVLPVIEAVVAARVAGRLPLVSIDTTKAVVADAALRAGADLVNDVSGGLFDADLLRLVAKWGRVIVLGHLRGTQATMHDAPSYRDVVSEVRDELRARIDAARAAGIDAARIFIDPGLGFAKRSEHNLALLARLDELRTLGHPIVVGASRKRFLGELGGGDVHHREEATAVAHALAIWNGADMVRVHDVERQAGAMIVAHAISSQRRR